MDVLPKLENYGICEVLIYPPYLYILIIVPLFSIVIPMFVVARSSYPHSIQHYFWRTNSKTPNHLILDFHQESPSKKVSHKFPWYRMKFHWIPLTSIHIPLKSIRISLKSIQIPLKSIHIPLKSIHIPLKSIHIPLKSIHIPFNHFISH